ncbi:MAG: peptidylprolyl isomerase [Gemmatimonadales bacterium]|jgi:parvulin-like peptidyl-prolyl isomerase
MNRITLRAGIRAIGLAWLAAAAGGARPDSAAAQRDPSELVEGVVALVGDTAITWTEFQQYLFQLQSEGRQMPEDPEGRRRFLEEALDSKVSDVVVYTHAQRAGITVSDRDVNEIVEERLAQIRRNFPTAADFQQALAAMGVTSAEFRIRLTQQTRVQLVSQQFLRQKYSRMQPVPVSEVEIREAFERQRASLGPRPATVSLKQVLIAPRASEEAELAARERAEQAISRLRAGEDFAVVARELSDDAGTREDGGLLGWVRQGQLLPEFEEAVFWMRPGQVSNIVETSVGYHIIKLERVRGAERLARHILVRLEVTDADAEAARRLAEEVAVALRQGADIDSLIDEHGDPSEQSALTNYPQERLPSTYQSELAGASPGVVIGPFLLASTAGGHDKWVVALISEMRPVGEWTLDDVRESLRSQIEQERTLEKIINDLREATYIETRLSEFPLPG